MDTKNKRYKSLQRYKQNPNEYKSMMKKFDMIDKGMRGNKHREEEVDEYNYLKDQQIKNMLQSAYLESQVEK